MKASSRLRPSVLGLLAFGLLASVPAQTVDKNPAAKAEVIARMNDLIARNAFVPNVDFAAWPKILESHKGAIDAANTDESFARAVNSALHDFGFSHILLATPRIADQRRTGKIVGIGITSYAVDKGIQIVRIAPDGSASEAGLKVGDIIVAVDGKKVEGISGIPGEAGTTVEVTVLHENGKEQKYRLTRREYSTVRPEELNWISADTAQLKIYTFDRSYNADRVEKLMKEASKARNLIVDLRGNGGGAVLNLQHLAGLLMPNDKTLGITVDKSALARYKRETGSDSKDISAIGLRSGRKIYPAKNDIAYYKGNITVFVDGGSGSASEILAAALKEQVDANVVGTKSAGAVLVSVIVPSTNGFFLQYPLSDFVTPRGRRLEGEGVLPDFVVKSSGPVFGTMKDPAIEAAVALFERARLRNERAAKGGDTGSDSR